MPLFVGDAVSFIIGGSSSFLSDDARPTDLMVVGSLLVALLFKTVAWETSTLFSVIVVPLVSFSVSV